MPFRFYRRVRVMPGMTVNLSKSGASLSFGRRGMHYTVGPRGRRVTVGVPGTGMYYTKLESARRTAGPRAASVPSVTDPAARLRIGFFKSLTTPPEERELVSAMRALVGGDEAAALAHARKATHLADGALLAGGLALRRSLPDEAMADLRAAVAGEAQLGTVVRKYGVDVSLQLAVTPEFSAHLPFDGNGARLALAEVCQHGGRADEAIDLLSALHARVPDDIVVTLSLAELLVERVADKTAQQKVLDLTAGVTNLTPVHTAALLYRGRALRILGLNDAAVQVLTTALSSKRDRGEDLLRAILYERAIALDAAGQQARANRELQLLYAADPRYEDVAARLGLTPSV